MSIVPAAPVRPVGRMALLAVLLAALLSGMLTLVTAAPAQARIATHAPAAAKAYPALRIGSTGSAVQYVQLRLYVSRTGYFGTRTAAAVRAFEKRHGFHKVDSVVGPWTWRALHVPYVRAHRSASRPSTSGSEATKRAAILRIAAAQVGKRYVTGGNGPSVFDCSGLVRYVVQHATGRLLPRVATDQMRATRQISSRYLRAGDLVFVHNGSRFSHAAIYAGNGYWYEAANSRKPVGKYKAWTTDVAYTTLF